MGPKVKESYSIQEALDNLAAIVGIDLESPALIGLVKGKRIVTDQEDYGASAVIWLSEEPEILLDVLDTTYRTIHTHLLSVLENPEMSWDDHKTLKGIAAMMVLVGESASKIEQYIEYRMGRKGVKITDRPEYQALQHFYLRRFANRVKAEEEEEYRAPPEALVDFEAVKRDHDYELFYLRKEDGKAYYNAELIRSLKLTVDFETDGESFEEDPLLKVRAMQDRDLHSTAGQILGDCHYLIEDYFKFVKKIPDHEHAKALSMAIIALFLAANPRNLVQNTLGKSCLQYYEDFHRFLRRSMRTPEYQRMIAYPPEKTDKVSHSLLNLTHSLCHSFFMRVGGVKQESIGLLHRTMRRGDETVHLPKGVTLWNQLILDDEKLRTLMAKFPNGPLFKILDLIRDEQDEDQMVPFDPIGQQNLPIRLYGIERRDKKSQIVRIPSPTSQTIINKVEILDEFRGYLRSLAIESPKKRHLLINLQDRTSWKEFSRCRALEELQKNAEYSQTICVMTLPKSTDFYHQNNEYLNMNSASEFLAAFREQLASPEQCGFFFPLSFKSTELSRFTEKALTLIHKEFFEGKNSLTRRNREDFIEIFYQFLCLKAIDLFDPDAVSFTCKDALDTGAAAHSAFYAFAQLFNGSLDGREELDYLRWLIYTPALFTRERPIDPERLNRTLSALETFDTQMGTRSAQIVKAFGELYSPNTLKALVVNRG